MGWTEVVLIAWTALCFVAAIHGTFVLTKNASGLTWCRVTLPLIAGFLVVSFMVWFSGVLGLYVSWLFFYSQ